MPGRNRRVRILALAVFCVVFVVLYRRNTATVDSYTDYIKEKAVGGGAVIRPKLDSPAQAPPAVGLNPEQEPAPARTTTSQSRAANGLPTASSTTTSFARSSESSSSHTIPSTTTAPSVPVQIPIHPDEEEEYPYAFGQGRVEVSVASASTTSKIHWEKQAEHFPISTTIQLPSGTSKPFPRVQRAVKKLSAAGADKEKLAVIKEAAQHAWRGYQEWALPADELRPVTGRSNNPFNGWGATLVDSLDTLWMMGMKAEFEDAVQAVKKIDFTTSPRSDIPLFETTIRYLGGLVAAYDVSDKKYRVLLDKAVELAEVLYGAFDTPNRMPETYYRWKPAFASQPHRSGTRVVLSELGTLSLDFTRLAQLTGEPKYYDAIARITDALEEWQNSTRLPGMWPTKLDASGCSKPAQMQYTLPNTQTVAGMEGAIVAAGSPVQASGEKPLRADRADVDNAPLRADNVPAGIAQRKKAEQVGPQQPGVGKTDARLPQAKEPKDDVLNGGAGGSLRAKRDLDFLDEVTPKNKLDETVAAAKNDRIIQRAGSKPQQNAQSNTDQRGQPICIPQGLRSTSTSGQESFTLAGESDSLYEYLPKEYLQLGGQVEQYRTMYLDSAATVIEKLLYRPMTIDERDILVSGQLQVTPNYSQPVEEREWIEKLVPEIAHLTCFAGGMFALGGVIFGKEEHVEIGSKLTDGCVWAYNVTTTGVMPEGAILMRCPETFGDCPWNETAYWEALDPYAESRTQMPGRRVEVAVTAAPKMVVTSSSSFATTTSTALIGAGPQPKPDLERKDVEGKAEDHRVDPNLNKRQLEKLDATKPEPPALPAPLPAVNKNAQTSTSASLAAIWTPPAPLSHEEFVKKKIEDERLPPGMVRISGRKYILRPEAIESVFYMYRITGDQYWRDVGWDMFTSVDRHTRTLHGNSAIDDITKSAPELVDSMESFWLAETLKYFYLLYDDPDRWSLDDWVLNTEAHLFRRPEYKFR